MKITNTIEISKKCNVSIHTKNYFLPEYPVPKEHNFDSFLVDLSNKRINKYINEFDDGKKNLYLETIWPTLFRSYQSLLCQPHNQGMPNFLVHFPISFQAQYRHLAIHQPHRKSNHKLNKDIFS